MVFFENIPGGRTPEIEEGSNLYVIHPASAWLVDRFARWGVGPNTASVLGLMCAVIAAVCFYNYPMWYMPILGFLFMLGWHVFDGADGQLARITGKASDFGKIIDGACDHLGFLSVYVAIILAIQPLYGPWVWLIGLGAMFSHSVQASSLEFQRDMYDCWIHRKEDKCVIPIDQLRLRRRQSTGVHKLVATLYLTYTIIQHYFAELSPELLTIEKQSRAQSNRRRQLDEIYRKYNLELVHQWTWLSSNKRTIAITLACLLKLPILFFLYEIVVLNLVLWWLKRRQRNVNANLVRSMNEKEMERAS